MAVPFSQMWTVATYVLKHRLRGIRRYPLVLMLEPLFRCNLACPGCGKIRQSADVLQKQLTPEQCFAAAEECAAPIVSVPGGEPLLHPQIGDIVAGLAARRRFVYLCTNAIRLEESLPRFEPSRHLALSVHIDGTRDEHDRAVARPGVYDIAVRAIHVARSRGFRVTTNTTLYAGMVPSRIREFFDEMTALGVEGMMVSPGYRYARAPDQDYFLRREQTCQMFREVLARPGRKWRFNQTPLFLQFLQGHYELECTPWGSPTYNVLGWQRPCYLREEGYCGSFQELMETTDWSGYGHRHGDAHCRDCMVHSGHEPSAVTATFGSWRGMLAATRSALGLPIRNRGRDRENRSRSIAISRRARYADCETCLRKGTVQP